MTGILLQRSLLRGTSRKGAGRRRVQMSRGVPPAIGSLIAVVALAACSLGSAVSPAAHGSGSSTVSSASGSASAGGQQVSSELETQVIDRYIPATGAEFAVGARFFGQMKAFGVTATSVCMAKYGFKYPKGSAEVIAANFWANGEFPDLGWMKKNGVLAPSDLNRPSMPPGGKTSLTPPSGPGAAEMADLKRCSASMKNPFAEVEKAGGSIEEQWSNVWLKIQSSQPVAAKRAEYSTCMQAAGVPASYASDFGRFMVWETGEEAQAKSDRELLAVSRKWEPIFVRCAEPTVVLQEKLQVEAKKTFVQEHFQQIKELSALAASASAEARAQSAG
jgi:hypothetical protein